MKIDIFKYFSRNKIEINRYIENIFKDSKHDYQDFGGFGVDAVRKLRDLSLLGKGVRGGLLIFAAESYRAKNFDVAYQLAASIELIHSALLIHDDIADNDLIRRGKPTIHARYLDYAKSENIVNAMDFAKSIATIVGDLGFFIAVSHISQVTKNLIGSQEILSLISSEISLVCLAQLDDIRFGFLNKNPDERDIKRVYEYKTARYSFTLPLLIGAKLAGANINDQKLLRLIGCNLGFIYQFRDDEIGLFSDTKSIGKPNGSDIRENKKTLLRQILYQKASQIDRKFLDGCFGNKKISNNDIDKVKQLVVNLDVKKDIDKLIIEYQNQVKTDIDKLRVSSKSKQFLSDLTEYVANREK